MWESRHVSKKWSILKGFGCNRAVLENCICCFEGERTVLSNNGRKNLFILSWFLAEVDFWKMFIDSSAVENSSIPLHYEEEITWKVMWRKIFLWLDLFWHFLIQSFKSIAPLLHDCDPDETSLYLQLSAHISEYLLIWFSITWRNIWFKMHLPTFLFYNALLVDSAWLETPGVVRGCDQGCDFLFVLSGDKPFLLKQSNRNNISYNKAVWWPIWDLAFALV